MKRIKDLISKPSEALQAMVDGLLAAKKDPKFFIDMDEFGKTNGIVCIGCAATCAVKKLVDFEITADNITDISTVHPSPDYKGWDTLDIWNFEVAINSARSGNLRILFDYFKIPPFTVPAPLTWMESCMDTHNWEEQLPIVINHIKKLQAAGY